MVGVSRLNENQGSVKIYSIFQHPLKLFTTTNQPTMAAVYRLQEDAIQHALHVYEDRKRENPDVTIAEIARELNVDYQRLRRRLQGKPSRSTRPPTNQRLDDAQYSALYRYLDYRMDLDIGVGADDIREAANMILRSDHAGDEPPMVSKMWPYSFMKQHPQYNRSKRYLIDWSLPATTDG